MQFGSFTSYEVSTNKDISALNNLLITAYADNHSVISTQKKLKRDYKKIVSFDNISDMAKHLLVKYEGNEVPCGTITIYHDRYSTLPLERELELSLQSIRNHNIHICEIGRLAMLSEFRNCSDIMLLLFLEVMQHCLNSHIHVIVTQAFGFNNKHFNRLGFKYFTGLSKGVIDKEFGTICYPMYILVNDIYEKLGVFFENGKINFSSPNTSNYELYKSILHNSNIANPEDNINASLV